MPLNILQQDLGPTGATIYGSPCNQGLVAHICMFPQTQSRAVQSHKSECILALIKLACIKWYTGCTSRVPVIRRESGNWELLLGRRESAACLHRFFCSFFSLPVMMDKFGAVYVYRKGNLYIYNWAGACANERGKEKQVCWPILLFKL